MSDDFPAFTGVLSKKLDQLRRDAASRPSAYLLAGRGLGFAFISPSGHTFPCMLPHAGPGAPASIVPDAGGRGGHPPVGFNPRPDREVAR